MEEINDLYGQFKGMQVPEDVLPLPVLTRDQIVKQMKRKVDISKTLILSLNGTQFRPQEIQIHTFDIGVNYKPDFDFTDIEEMDAWKKTCKLKYNLQQFKDVDLVRCEGFLHKMQICESLTLFEEIHRMLKLGGKLLIEVLDLHTCMKNLTEISPRNLFKTEYYEDIIFSRSDCTGIYYNRTIWTFERLQRYLEIAHFINIKNITKDSTNFRLLIEAEKS